MSGRVITVAQQKGGAGKTTVAIQLGVAFAAGGQRVAMLDIDPQGSLFAWFGARRRRLGDSEDGPVVLGLSGWRIASEVRRFRQEFDFVLVDTPPRTESEARAAIRAADLTLIPCQPNALDVWATAPTIELAAGEGTRALLVLNRMPPRSRTAEAAQEEIQKSGWPLAQTHLGNRQAFAASLGEGRGVAETAARSPAGQEIEALAEEIRRTLA